MSGRNLGTFSNGRAFDHSDPGRRAALHRYYAGRLAQLVYELSMAQLAVERAAVASAAQRLIGRCAFMDIVAQAQQLIDQAAPGELEAREQVQENENMMRTDVSVED